MIDPVTALLDEIDAVMAAQHVQGASYTTFKRAMLLQQAAKRARAFWETIRVHAGPRAPVEQLVSTLPPGHPCHGQYDADSAPLAERLYAAYTLSSGGLNWQGQPCPTWSELPATIRHHWCQAATIAMIDGQEDTIHCWGDFERAIEKGTVNLNSSSSDLLFKAASWAGYFGGPGHDERERVLEAARARAYEQMGRKPERLFEKPVEGAPEGFAEPVSIPSEALFGPEFADGEASGETYEVSSVGDESDLLRNPGVRCWDWREAPADLREAFAKAVDCSVEDYPLNGELAFLLLARVDDPVGIQQVRPKGEPNPDADYTLYDLCDTGTGLTGQLVWEGVDYVGVLWVDT